MATWSWKQQLVLVSPMRPQMLPQLRAHSRHVCGVDTFLPLHWLGALVLRTTARYG